MFELTVRGVLYHGHLAVFLSECPRWVFVAGHTAQLPSCGSVGLSRRSCHPATTASSWIPPLRNAQRQVKVSGVMPSFRGIIFNKYSDAKAQLFIKDRACLLVNGVKVGDAIIYGVKCSLCVSGIL